MLTLTQYVVGENDDHTCSSNSNCDQSDCRCCSDYGWCTYDTSYCHDLPNGKACGNAEEKEENEEAFFTFVFFAVICGIICCIACVPLCQRNYSSNGGQNNEQNNGQNMVPMDNMVVTKDVEANLTPYGPNDPNFNQTSANRIEGNPQNNPENNSTNENPINVNLEPSLPPDPTPNSEFEDTPGAEFDKI